MVADQVLALVQGELETNQISLRNEMQGRPTEVFGDRIQLQQVLLNLIMNAIEAMSSETSRERNLMITSGIDDGMKVRITVEDTGGGIDPARLDQNLRPFLHDKVERHGLGSIHLPVNHRSAWRKVVGIATKSIRNSLPFNFADRRYSAATEVKADQGVIRN